MRIRHYITMNAGGGPISLVSIMTDGAERMIRVNHHARYGKVAEVDPVEARRAVEAAHNLHQASASIPEEHRDALAAETLAYASRMGCRAQALRWTADGDGVVFAKAEEANEWDAAQVVEAGPAELVKRRRRIMMG